MKITLNSLKIENFRVIHNLEITPNGSNLAIYGKNKRGKTTIYDAFLWLLFGKNSSGETNFGIKPTNLPVETENSVEAEFTVDGKPLVLKKVNASKYIKTTGEYKGSELEYYINGVPKKKNEYVAFISQLIDEDKFKLLTNPHHFTENLNWQSRRNILFGITDILSDAELAERTPGYEFIAPEIAKHGSISDFFKAIAAQVKENSEKINDIPMRIAENSNKIQSVSRRKEDISSENMELSEKIKANSEKIGALKNQQPEYSEKYKAAQKSLAELETRNSEHKKQQEETIAEKKRALSDKYNEIRCKLVEENAKKSSYENELKHLSERRNELLRKRKEIEAMTFEAAETCPTCGQAIPKEQISKAESKFIALKEQSLTENTTNGKAIRAKLDEITAQNNACHENIMKLESEMSELQAKLNSITISTFDLPEYEDSKAEILKTMQDIISDESNTAKEEIALLTAENEGLADKIKINNEILSVISANESFEERITELRSRQATLRSEQAKLQQMYDLAAEFVRFKTDSVTESINSKFKITKFKLFEPNKTNNGLQECCEALAFNSTRYNDINTAGKVLVGVDIIHTLAEHYGLSVPLFIDNIDGLDAESYQQLIDSISGTMQLITLRVSDEDDTLRTEEF